MSKREEASVKTIIKIMEHNPNEECQDVLSMIRLGYNCDECSHPADYLEVKNVKVDRDIMEKPVSIWDPDPKVHMIREYIPSQVHCTVECYCSKCKSIINIYGSAG